MNKNFKFRLTPAYCLYNGVAVIEQQGTNQDIYSNPVNSFVANFMGKANFVDVKSAKKISGTEKAEAEVFGKTLSIKCTPDFETGVCLIRPEDIHFDSASELKARVVHASYFGNMVEYELDIQGNRLYMTEFGNTTNIIPTGSSVGVKFNIEKMRLLPDKR